MFNVNVNFASIVCLCVFARCFVTGDVATMTVAAMLNLVVVAIGRRLDAIEAKLTGPKGGPQ